jgi:3-oxoadipate enol-lactonase
MPVFNYQGLAYYYEVHGQGTPLLLLNGIMMSTKSWRPFVPAFSSQHQLILLDMLDQGQSARATTSYTQAHQVQVVMALCQHLQIHHLAVMGISYGGEVALQLAITAPQLISHLMIFNSVAYTDSTLKALGDQWNDVASRGDGEAYYALTIPVIYSDTFKATHQSWLEERKKVLLPIFQSPVFLNAMIRLTKSAESHDVRWAVSRITMPTLIVGSSEDTLTPYAMQVTLASFIPHAHLLKIEHAGHASMYEKPSLFTSLILGFIAPQPDRYQI